MTAGSSRPLTAARAPAQPAQPHECENRRSERGERGLFGRPRPYINSNLQLGRGRRRSSRYLTESHPRRADAPPRAPALSVRGPGGGEVTIPGLAAGGCALLLFVSEECPTSAMALRRLGPLCRAWAEAGLTATAVFENPLEVAVRVARHLGWPGRVVSEDPPYETSHAYRLVSVPTAVLVDRAGRSRAP
jgi:AhpC/TSA family